MIQLDSRKKIIIISGAVLLIIVVIVVLLVIKNKQNNILINDLNEPIKTRQPRLMTEKEKVETVGIDPTQETELVNDQSGNYIYRLKK
jgi:hypothetical protein